MSHWYVAIGASGEKGLGDIKDVLRNLPMQLDIVVLVVLHRLWDKPSHLAAVLGRASKRPVKVAQSGQKFEVGTVYVGELGLPLNGRTVTFAENIFYEFEDSKIKKAWSVIDKTAIEAQLP